MPKLLATQQHSQAFGKVTRQHHLQLSTQNLAELFDLTVRVQSMYLCVQQCMDAALSVRDVKENMAYDGLPSKSSGC